MDLEESVPPCFLVLNSLQFVDLEDGKIPSAFFDNELRVSSWPVAFNRQWSRERVNFLAVRISERWLLEENLGPNPDFM